MIADYRETIRQTIEEYLSGKISWYDAMAILILITESDDKKQSFSAIVDKRIDSVVKLTELNPNDTIIIRVKEEVSDTDYDQLLSKMRKIFRSNKVLVLDASFNIEIVRQQKPCPDCGNPMADHELDIICPTNQIGKR